MKQIVAMGGGGFSMEPETRSWTGYVLGLTGKTRPRSVFCPPPAATQRATSSSSTGR